MCTKINVHPQFSLIQRVFIVVHRPVQTLNDLVNNTNPREQEREQFVNRT